MPLSFAEQILAMLEGYQQGHRSANSVIDQRAFLEIFAAAMTKSRRFNPSPLEISELYFDFDFAALMVPPTQVYIDPVNGNDANDGLTPATAKKSWFNAYNVGPLLPPLSVIYMMMPGVHDNVPLNLFGGMVQAVGTDFTVHVPLATPSAASAANRTMQFAGAAWAVDEHRGRLVHIPHWENPFIAPFDKAGACYAIIGNTADTLTLACPDGVAVNTFPVEIVTPAASCQPPFTMGATFNLGNFDLDMSAAGGNLYNSGGNFLGCILKGAGAFNGSFSSQNTSGCYVHDFGGFDFQNYNNVANSLIDLVPGSFFNVRENNFNDTYIKGDGSQRAWLPGGSNNGATLNGKTTFDGVTLGVTNYGRLTIGGGANTDVQVKNCTGSGIELDNSTLETYSVLGGSGNGGWGVMVGDGSFVRTSGNVHTITGVPGNYTMDGGVTPQVWGVGLPLTDPVHLNRVS